MVRYRHRVTLVAALMAAAGCGGDSAPADMPRSDSAWRGTVEMTGKLTTVSNDSGQVWRSVELIEEVSIGVLDGADEYVFGDVASLAADDERIYVLDRMANTVRVYDLSGQHLFDIGRPGDGPGEFRRPWVLGLADGARLLVRDISQSRMHEFSADTGELLADWRASGGGPTVITPQGNAYLYNRMRERNRRGGFDFEMVVTGPDGPGTAIVLPGNNADPPWVTADRRGLEVAVMQARMQGLAFSVILVPFAHQRAWAVGPDGLLAVGEAVDYAFWTRSLDGSETRIDRGIEPVKVDPREAAWYRNRITDFWRAKVPDFVWAADIPATKRAYVALIHDHSGRLWVLRELAGEPLAGCDPNPAELEGYMLSPCWQQPFVLDGFASDGRFLGALDLPAEMRTDILPYIRDDLMLAVSEDQDGTVMVKRYRLEVTE